jgi:hypothetical protein
LKGSEDNIPIDATVNCLNHEEFFNQFISYPYITLAQDTTNIDNYEISMLEDIDSYTTGLAVNIKFSNGNTGPATLNINEVGVKDIKKDGDRDLEANDIKSNQIVSLVYDGTNFQIVGGAGISISGGAYITYNPDNESLEFNF